MKLSKLQPSKWLAEIMGSKFQVDKKTKSFCMGIIVE